jgi:endonuclease YncB( thermonuclease family)
VLLAAAWLGAAAFARADSALAQPGCLAETTEATVTEVVDVRTLRLADGSLIRIAGIEPIDLLFDDAEEAVEGALKKRVAELALEKVIAVQPLAEKTDRYGRMPAMVSASGASMQEALAREGLAIAFAAEEVPLPCFDRILAAEEEARHDRRGFWIGERLPEARPRALASRIGHFAIFEGDVASVRNRRARTYLNFGDVWSADATAEIEAGDREKFGGELALEQLAGKRVRLRGFIEERGGPVIVLSSPMQLEILGFAEPGPIAP